LPKRGFTAPVGEWISGPYATRFQDEVLHQQSHVAGCIDLRTLRSWMEDPLVGSRGYAMWAVWVLERWLQMAAPKSSSLCSPV
jgi:hypothetical protein